MRCVSYSKLVMAIASLLIISGCESTSATGENNAGNLSESNQALSELVENNACTASFQCKVLEVGQRACGGPSRYAIYSTLNTEQEAAEQLANKITEQETIANQASGASDCLPVLPVQALCISNQCQSFDVR